MLSSLDLPEQVMDLLVLCLLVEIRESQILLSAPPCPRTAPPSHCPPACCQTLHKIPQLKNPPSRVFNTILLLPSLSFLKLNLTMG